MGVIDYLKETKEEMTHVSWPTQKQVTMFTLFVIGISIATAVFLGFFDQLFTYLLDRFIV
jgi:preprotein translocase SecE subunit